MTTTGPSTQDIATTLAALSTHQTQHPLTLLKLSQPLLSARQTLDTTANPRISDSSQDASAQSDATPAALAADLAHYRSLFAKLRLSYTTQVTKEKFLRNLISTPRPDPSTLSAFANAELERSCAELKAELQARKKEVDELVGELERRARGLCRRYLAIEDGKGMMESLGGDIEGLKAELGRVRREVVERGGGDVDGLGMGDDGEGSALNLGLEATVNLVEEKEEQLEGLDRQLEALAEARASREKELRRMKDELDAAERIKNQAVRGADEAKRRRQEGKGGTGDEVEERGRWLRGVEATMRGVLEIEA